MTRCTIADVRKLSAALEPLILPKWEECHWPSFGSMYGTDVPGVFDLNCQMKLLFELDRLPLVWTPEDVARVMRRPKIDIDSEDEFEVAERMAVLWMQYAQEVKR